MSFITLENCEHLTFMIYAGCHHLYTINTTKQTNTGNAGLRNFSSKFAQMMQANLGKMPKTAPAISLFPQLSILVSKYVSFEI